MILQYCITILFIYCLLDLVSFIPYHRAQKSRKDKFDLFVKRANSNIDFLMEDILHPHLLKKNNNEFNYRILPGITFLLEENSGDKILLEEESKIRKIFFKMRAKIQKRKNVHKTGKILYLNTAFGAPQKTGKDQLNELDQIRRLAFNANADLILVNGLGTLYEEKKLNENMMDKIRIIYKRLLDNNMKIIILESRENITALDGKEGFIDNIVFIHKGKNLFNGPLKTLKYKNHDDKTLQDLAHFLIKEDPSSDQI